MAVRVVAPFPLLEESFLLAKGRRDENHPAPYWEYEVAFSGLLLVQ